MTIYNQISSNRTRTFLIIGFFIAFMSFFFFLVGKFVGNTSFYFVIGLLVSLASGFFSYFYSDKMVLFMTGAKPADKRTYFDLYTVVENMSMAAGMPMPKVYVINDPAPNAFATGRDPKHAVVVATSGILQVLDRTELEAVIAHEMSHVKNYDILVSSVVAVLVGTIAFVADWIMRGFLWGGLGDNEDSNSRKNNQLFLFIFVILLVLSPIIATLIQLAVSRRREYLADASGALLNRNPDALADALNKISSDPRIMHTASNATAHLFIANPFQKKKNSEGQGFVNWISGLFSTHPPIQERIRILREM